MINRTIKHGRIIVALGTLLIASNILVRSCKSGAITIHSGHMTTPNFAFLNIFERQGVAPQMLINFVNNLGLPLPKTNEFFRTSDDGAIIAVNDAGVIIRFAVRGEKNPCYDIRHRDVVPPIVQLDQGNLHIEILPGLGLGNNARDLHQLATNLEKDGIIYDDRLTKVENIGYLPDGRPIILDRHALKPTSDYQPMNDEDLPLFETRQVLTKQFAQSIPTPFADASENNPETFWAACRTAKGSGQLQSGWLAPQYKNIVYYHNHGQTSEVQRTSLHYAEHVPRKPNILERNKRAGTKDDEVKR